jgi:hypothetical protein
MNATTLLHCGALGLLALALGYDPEPGSSAQRASRPGPARSAAGQLPDGPWQQGDGLSAIKRARPLVAMAREQGASSSEAAPAPSPAAKKVKIAKNVLLEIDGKKRRVLVDAYVCQQRAMLEHFLTRKRTKEHEAVVAADVDARTIHAALVAAAAEPGSPVRYRPYKPAHGTRIKVFVRYKDESDKVVTVPAQTWVRHAKTKKDLEYEWVFAGSLLIPDPLRKVPPYYAANDGDLICVSNFDTAMLDLPVASSKDNDELEFEANTERIPALGTPVTVILEPVLSPKKK